LAYFQSIVLFTTLIFPLFRRTVTFEYNVSVHKNLMTIVTFFGYWHLVKTVNKVITEFLSLDMLRQTILILSILCNVFRFFF